MELIQFYFLNLIVGAVLAITLGLYGAHTVARNKTMETILLGQSIQVGILLGVILGSVFTSDHDDHGLHIEIFISVIFTVSLYSLYEWITQSKKYAKTPVLVSFYTVLISFSYFIVAASPLIESHMVKAFLGDIVTASKLELILIFIMSGSFLSYFTFRHSKISQQSFDLSSFGHLISSGGKKDNLIFNIIILMLMIYSIHVLGIVFTLAMMILPVTFNQFNQFTLKGLYQFIILCGPLSVLFGFLLNIRYENIPTSSLIVLVFTLMNIGTLILRKR